MTRSALAWGLRKEFRALLPAWLACVLALAAAMGSVDVVILPSFRALGTLAFGLGCLILGAQSIGHEYAYGTLGSLLAAPIDRRRLLLTKIAVLATMLLSLVLMGLVLLNVEGGSIRVSPEGGSRGGIWRVEDLLLLAPLMGLAIAPTLTMLARSSQAGVVFTLTIPALLLIIGDLIGLAWFGSDDAAAIDALKGNVFWFGMLVAFGVSAVAGWLRFMRLDVVDHRGDNIDLPAFVRWRTTAEGERRRRAPAAWMILKKELRLQTPVLVVALLYLLVCASLLLSERVTAVSQRDALLPLTMLCVATVALLSPALVSAEERQLGTLDWHSLLPVPAWKQWTLKAGTAVAIVVLAVFLAPAAAAALAGEQVGWSLRPGMRSLETIAVLFGCSLFVSSLSTSGLRAFLVSIPYALGALLVLHTVVPWFWWSVWAVSGAVRSYRAFQSVELPLRAGLSIGFAVLLVSLAFSNHRSVDRGRGRIWRQVLAICALLALATVAGAIALARLSR